MKKMKRTFLLKAISITLILTLVYNTVFPTVAWAVTSGNNQPEYYGYQPVNATDNVSLTTGAFSYSIPVTSVPEYPMAIGYNSNVKPGQEASTFGYGFNGFSGAINRNKMGLPDDLNGGKRKYRYENEVHWYAGGGATVNLVLPYDIGGHPTMNFGYDNYKGMYGDIGAGLSVGVGNIGVGFSSSSRLDGLAGYAWASSTGFNISNSYILNAISHFNVGIYGVADDGSKPISDASFISSAGIKDFSMIPPPRSTNDLPDLPSVSPVSKGYGVSLSVPIPGGPLTINGEYGKFWKEENADKEGYGFMYLKNYNRKDFNEDLADMAIEGEYAFPNNRSNSSADPRLNPVYLQRDYFSVNAMGFRGNMQLYQEEYGVVSRNYFRTQYRDVGLTGIKTERRETYPWSNVVQARQNKAVDILKVLKSDEPNARDFDQTFFIEKERADLTTGKYSFGNTQFKMRGDMAGEYNLGSADYNDREPNDFHYTHIQGSGGGGAGFLYIERETPLYKPELSTSFSNKLSGRTIEQSTHIEYSTIDQLCTMYSDLASKTPFEDKNLENSFYTHHELIGTPDHFAGYTYKFNILKHLNSIKENEGNYAGDIIGRIETKNASGVRYVFGLPVFTKNNKTLQLSGKGQSPPVKKGNNDYQSYNGKNRNKATIEDDYQYPYAWLLTAIVGADYVDFDDIPGPSDGDLGYWVKFKYTRIADQYRWRFPYAGLAHSPGAIYKSDDDGYGMQTGEKEIYVLAEIESSDYVCVYDYEKRYDGIDAAGYWNGDAVNMLVDNYDIIKNNPDPTGSHFQYTVTQIDLYKKHFTGEHNQPYSGSYGKRIKSTIFKYDYTLCPDVENNVSIYSNSKSPVDIQYLTSASAPKSGKITLRKVQNISYDEDGNPVKMPAYGFSYYADDDPKYNPPYDRKQVDRWGNYAVNTKIQKSTQSNLYHSYCEYNPEIADENANAYRLKTIHLPSAGTMEVSYKANAYAYVQDKKAYVMRRIKQENTFNENGNKTTIKVDVTDICREEIRLGASVPQGFNRERSFFFPEESNKPLLETGGDNTLYGEVAFYRTNLNTSNNNLYIASADNAVIYNIEAPVQDIGNTWYQPITLSYPDKNDPPFIYECKKYMYNESEEMMALKKCMGGCGCSEGKIGNLKFSDTDDGIDVLRDVLSNFVNFLTSDAIDQDKFDRCFESPGTYYHAGLSFIRTPVFKAKYTGSRVDKIVFNDNFNYATNPNDPANTKMHENQYGTQYYFDLHHDGTGMSSGVATIEPMGGKAAAIDIRNLTGAGYHPSPSIISSQTTLEGLYTDHNTTDDIYPRKKGKTIYGFHTPKEESLKPMKTFKQKLHKNPPGNAKGRFYMYGILTYLKIKFKFLGKKITIKIPYIMPLFLNWQRNAKYQMKSYAYTDLSDMYGKPSFIKQVNAAGQQKAMKEYIYYADDEGIPMYKEGFNASDKHMIRPGKMDQVWSEAYYTKKTKLYYLLLYLSAETKRHYNYINMKHTYIPPVVKEIRTSVDGQQVTDRHTGFDYYTGTPIQLESEDSYYNTKIKRIIPAYWKYGQLGPGRINNLTAKTGEYLYLNQIVNDSLIRARITEWGVPLKDYDFISYLQPEKITSGNGTHYLYQKKNADAISNAYLNGTGVNDEHIKHHNSLYKPVASHVYETDLNKNGTYASFIPYDYNAAVQGEGWKQIIKKQLYDAKGNVIQTEDVLGKNASRSIGYNTTNVTASVSNARWGEWAYSGAENVYTAGVVSLLDNNAYLGYAEIYNAAGCYPSYSSYTMDLYDYDGSDAYIYEITPPEPPVYNTPFARLDVTFDNDVDRQLYISMKENGKYQVVSAMGEDFKGYMILPPEQENTTRMLFDYHKFNNITVDAGYPLNGFTFTSVYEALNYNCDDQQIEYFVPDNTCPGEAHTGKYAFMLEPGKTGTSASIPLNNNTPKKFKAMVWVHNSSPQATGMVLNVFDANVGYVREKTVSLADAYVEAGNWKLLRMNISLSGDQVDDGYFNIAVTNNADDGIMVYDDFRVLPYHAQMKNYVYDHAFNRVTSTLDANNFATWYEYDARGRLVKQAVEIENIGKKIIQKKLYNDQKPVD